MTDVIAAVACGYCHSGYVPTEDQATVLRAIRAVREWVEQATRFALDRGWYQRADGDLLCREHAEIKDEPLRRLTVAQWAAVLPPKSTPPRR